ncbi:hypothetical protein [Roseofilum capinflatum]|uniref:Uncharacterized protein n=1 Tax=Roseofilum capinflatum BLCC-M114 TaxID=3022440 RepID=A0ABT7B1R7_9CYAN|nr:hypothetical protein [Roseofilum capinflatum]MDJ1173081.1 hypothetical protein [Roseofilum capinflatum BLCC-M114]
MSAKPITFEAIATVVEMAIADVSKRAGVKNLKTYVTVRLEQVLPADLAEQVKVETLNFIYPTQKGDEQIQSGDRVQLTIIANDLSQPDWFRMTKMLKL